MFDVNLAHNLHFLCKAVFLLDKNYKKNQKNSNLGILHKLFNYGPLAKLDKALGYEPGDSRFEFWAVHQKRKCKCWIGY